MALEIDEEPDGHPLGRDGVFRFHSTHFFKKSRNLVVQKPVLAPGMGHLGLDVGVLDLKIIEALGDRAQTCFMFRGESGVWGSGAGSIMRVSNGD